MKDLGEGRQGSKLIPILIIIILLLVLIVVYILVLQPRFNAYVIEKQVNAQQQVVGALIQSINQNGFVQITDAQGNTIVLVPLEEEEVSQMKGQPRQGTNSVQ